MGTTCALLIAELFFFYFAMKENLWPFSEAEKIKMNSFKPLTQH